MLNHNGKTKIKLTFPHGEYKIQLKDNPEVLPLVLADLIFPALLSAGYSQDLIDECLQDYVDTLEIKE